MVEIGGEGGGVSEGVLSCGVKKKTAVVSLKLLPYLRQVTRMIAAGLLLVRRKVVVDFIWGEAQKISKVRGKAQVDNAWVLAHDAVTKATDSGDQGKVHIGQINQPTIELVEEGKIGLIVGALEELCGQWTIPRFN